jgi:hypothetical protein
VVVLVLVLVLVVLVLDDPCAAVSPSRPAGTAFQGRVLIGRGGGCRGCRDKRQKFVTAAVVAVAPVQCSAGRAF